MNAHTLKIKDFALHQERTLKVTPSLVRFALERRCNVDTNSAETSLIGMSFFTQSTRRETAMDIYTTYPLNERDLNHISNLMFQSRIAVPSLGEKRTVRHPLLDPAVYADELHEGDFFFPLFIMHTHPSQLAVISARDTNGDGDMPALLSRYSTHYTLGDAKFQITSPAIHVIAAQNGLEIPPIDTGFLFYQFTGNHGAFDTFAKEYSALRMKTLGSTQDSVLCVRQAEADYAFSKEMNRSGAFKAMYFPPASAQPIHQKLIPLYHRYENGHVCIDPKNLSRICQNFTYEARVKRVA
ncbi:MAG: hypothetical protein AABY00_02115 [Nanoarchaeota archaeon]